MRYYEFFYSITREAHRNKCRVKKCHCLKADDDSHFCRLHRQQWRNFLESVPVLDGNFLEGLLEDFISR